MAVSSSLRITEIFHSLQGESNTVGLPTVFVRLTGCPLRCQYCDTAYAFEGGEQVTIDDILAEVAQYDCPYVTVTGGEPLAQPNCLSLLEQLCDLEYEVSLETSGAMAIDKVDARVSVVLDIKTPGSGECSRNRLDNFPELERKDQVKFVICNRDDYEWSKAQLLQFNLCDRVGDILFSPSYEELPAAELADWILNDRLQVRMQLQIHKILWDDEAGR